MMPTQAFSATRTHAPSLPGATTVIEMLTLAGGCKSAGENGRGCFTAQAGDLALLSEHRAGPSFHNTAFFILYFGGGICISRGKVMSQFCNVFPQVLLYLCVFVSTPLREIANFTIVGNFDVVDRCTVCEKRERPSALYGRDHVAPV